MLSFQYCSSGWRDSALRYLRTFCSQEDVKGEQLSPSILLMFSSDVVDCIRENTFSLNSTIKASRLGLDLSLWSSYMATIYFGMCHTFTNNQSIKIFHLDPQLNYRIFIHDPNYYHLLIRSLIPRILLQYKAGKDMEPGAYDYLEITATEHQRLNRPEQPCEEAEDYNFLECVKTSQARRVGCRPPWDSWSPPTLPLCQTLEELQHHEELDNTSLQSDQQMIVNQTGCNIPCQFKVGHLRKSQQLNTYFPGL